MTTATRHFPTAARLLLGLSFFVFGLNGFLSFLPMPPPPPAAGAFFGALAATGYMLPLIKGTEVLAGALLLSNRFVPLALTFLGPVLVNIVLFHFFLASPSPLVFVLVGLELFLAYAHRDAFRGVLRARSTPAPTAEIGTTERLKPAAA